MIESYFQWRQVSALMSFSQLISELKSMNSVILYQAINMSALVEWLRSGTWLWIGKIFTSDRWFDVWYFTDA